MKSMLRINIIIFILSGPQHVRRCHNLRAHNAIRYERFWDKLYATHPQQLLYLRFGGPPRVRAATFPVTPLVPLVAFVAPVADVEGGLDLPGRGNLTPS